MINYKIFDNFYCIEGVNGAGKTTIIEKLKEKARQFPDVKFVFLKEPHSFIHSSIKFIEENLGNDKEVLTHLYLASRLYTIKNKENGIYNLLQEAYSKKETYKIIIDRYEFSTWVYQNRGFQGASWAFPFPVKLFYVYADVEVLKNRPNCPKDIQDHLMKYNNVLDSIRDEYKKIRIYRLINNNLNDLNRNVNTIFELIMN